LFLFASSALAHDGEWGDANNPIDFSEFGLPGEVNLAHADADPWKGWAKMWVRNNWCGDAWGDFHLKIKGFNISSVDFVADALHEPELWVYSGGSWQEVPGLTWNINNTVVGAEMDLYFYGDPIEQGQKAWLKVYTDNTSQSCSLFYVAAHPTPVPEPATILLLGLGTCGLLRRRKRE
jgi:hypothetical protein